MKLTEKEKEILLVALTILKEESEELLVEQPRYRGMKENVKVCTHLIKKLKK